MARVAILDANVLWPQYLRDVLIRAAIADVYRAVWTDQILTEMRDSLLRRDRVLRPQIDRTVQFMRLNCAHFMVEGYEDLIAVMTNDPKDRHVLAAAVCAGADTIVTNNRKHFPPSSREKYGIDVHSPDQFLVELWQADMDRMARMLVGMAAGLRNPPLGPHELVEQRISAQAPRFAQRVLASDQLDQALEAERKGIPPPQYSPL